MAAEARKSGAQAARGLRAWLSWARLGSPGRPGAAPRPPRPAEGAPERGGAGRKRRQRSGVRCQRRRETENPRSRNPPAWRQPPSLGHLSPAPCCGPRPAPRPEMGSLQVSLAARPPPGRLLHQCPEPCSLDLPRLPKLGAAQDAPSEAPPAPARPPQRPAQRSSPPLSSRGRRTRGSLQPARLFSFCRFALRSTRLSESRVPPRPPSVPCAGFMNGGKRPHAAAAASC
ncbi:hypothetical protein AB1E18_002280 [Capra hircus]